MALFEPFEILRHSNREGHAGRQLEKWVSGSSKSPRDIYCLRAFALAGWQRSHRQGALWNIVGRNFGVLGWPRVDAKVNQEIMPAINRSILPDVQPGITGLDEFAGRGRGSCAIR